MDCNQAWNLMMKSLDNENNLADQDRLKEHLLMCNTCKKQYDALNMAFDEMAEFEDLAPDHIEKRVMLKLKTVQKPGTYLLPYVVTPLLMVLLLLGFGFYQAIKTGPISLLDQVFKTLAVAHGTSQALLSIFERIFSLLYMKQALIVLLIVGVLYSLYIVIKHYRKIRKDIIGGW